MKTKKLEIRDLTKTQILDAVKIIHGDGHTLFDPNSFITKAMWPKELVDQFTEVHESNPKDFKETIFLPNGKIANQMKAVYGLRLLRRISEAIGSPLSDARGRGWEARELTENIIKHYE